MEAVPPPQQPTRSLCRVLSDSDIQHPEEQYLQLIQRILTEGDKRETRNGKTISVFGHTLEFDLQRGYPLLTTKKMAWKCIVTELAWFLRGSTDVKELQAVNNRIWDANAAANGGTLGPIYGHQWRKFGSSEDGSGGVDQVAYVIKLLKTNPTSRRIFLSAWNPSDMKRMALPPCHVSYQFYVQNGVLSCQMYQRSSDVFLGLPFNIASTALFTCLLAHECDLSVGKIRLCLGDAHIYAEHVEAAKLQLTRVPKPFPWVEIKRKKDGLHDVKYKEIRLCGYESHGRIKANMKA